MGQNRYEFTSLGWREKLPSIVLRVFCAILLVGFCFDCIHATTALDRSRSLGIVVFLSVFYANLDISKHDLRMFFEQPTDIAGTPVLLISALIGFYSVYLNA